MSVTIGGNEFDRVEYDADGDVLYLHVGDPVAAVEFEETIEGHHVRLGRQGEIVGLTFVGPKRLLAELGELRVTPPVSERVDATELNSVLG